MNESIVIDCIIIIGCALLGFVPFDKKRCRADWAKTVFLLISVIGIVKGSVILAWDLGWFSIGSRGGQILWNYNSMTGGVLIGLLLALIVSGELTGRKRVVDGAMELREV